MSEVSYDEVTQNVFWRTMPKDAYDPARHRFRVATVEENRRNIARIYAMIRRFRPNAKIILTLSPVPLVATFRNKSCISSNSVSKAALRLAIDEVVRKHAHEGVLFYRPSYEIVNDVFRSPYKSDRRHPRRPIIDYMTTEF